MIYLLGTSHDIQTEWGNPPPDLSAKFKRFRAYVEATVLTKNIAVIAEEAHQEIEVRDGRKSIARFVAEDQRPPIYYLPCEPSLVERRALGIPTGEEILSNTTLFGDALTQYRDSELLKYFPLREEYWIECLRPHRLGTILFICGANHIPTLSCRLNESGIPCQILSFDWWASDDNEYGPLPLAQTPI